MGALLACADEINVPLLSLVFSWLLHHHQVSSVIAGATSPEQIRANTPALRALTNEPVAHLDSLTA